MQGETYDWATVPGRLEDIEIFTLGYNYRFLDTLEKVRSIPAEEWLKPPFEMTHERFLEIVAEIKRKAG